jgi:hypothetical protein
MVIKAPLPLENYPHASLVVVSVTFFKVDVSRGAADNNEGLLE